MPIYISGTLIFLELKDLTSICAIIISLISLFVGLYIAKNNFRLSTQLAKKNVRLSIQQALFKTVTEKAKDCNEVWSKVPSNEYAKAKYPQYATVAELIISFDVIEKAFKLFEIDDDNIFEQKIMYFELFYKQLSPFLRSFINFCFSTDEYVKVKNPHYIEQVDRIQSTLFDFFEKLYPPR